MRALLLTALLGLVPLAACDEGRGTKALGEPCGGDSECRSGLCVGGVVGEDPACTRSCSKSGECPDGWSCSGVTEDQVLVCRKGPATPFGR